MSDSKFTDQLVKMRCEGCNKLNYYTRKNKKQVKRKLEIKKFCKWCRKHHLHTEHKK